MGAPLLDGGGEVFLDRYELGARIARGGMADVFEAQDLQLQRRVAVKVFRSTAGDRARFDAEAITLAALSHPGLVQVYDAGEHQGDAFLVLELVDGPTLASRVRDTGPASPADVAGVGARVADALAYVHASGVVHRDVTPSNILCGPDGRPRLADFGIARLIDTTRVTAPSTALGTAAYMAPEQVLGEDVTPAADVYSLGLVLFEMLTGSKAFDGPPQEAVVARLARQPELPGGAPDDWSRLIHDMTDRTPSARPAAGEVRDRLEAMSTVPLAPTEAFVVAPSVLAASVGAAVIPSDDATRMMSRADGTALLPAGLVSDGEPEPRTIPAVLLFSVVAVLVAVAVFAGVGATRGTEDTPTASTTPVTEPAIPVVTTTPTTDAPAPRDDDPAEADGTGGATDGGAPSREGTGNGQEKEKKKDEDADEEKDEDEDEDEDQEEAQRGPNR